MQIGLIDTLLGIIYTIGVLYLGLFLIPLRTSTNQRYKTDKKDTISVIIPIYKESTELVKNCLDTILKQNTERIRLYVVLQATNEAQRNVINSYKPHFKFFKIMKQKNPSLTNACKKALDIINTEYVCIINSDIILEKDAISRLFGYIKSEEVDIGFPLLLPKPETKFAQFVGIKKLIRQFLFQYGRGSMNMGYYIPGAFYIAKSQILRTNLRNNLTDDIALTFKAYSSRKIKLGLLPIPLAYELEKRSFLSWSMQFSRWFIGNLKISDLFMEVFKKAEPKIKLGVFGLVYLWYILPISIIIGLVSVIFFNFNPIIFALFYCVLTALLYGVKQIAKLNPIYVLCFWIVYPSAKVLGIIMSVYTYWLYTYKKGKTYLIFKR